MPILHLLLLALALAMDAFAVAVTTGVQLSCQQGCVTPRQVFRLAFYFGLFQFLMPVIGWLAGLSVRDLIENWDHWVAFGLLALVGLKMIHEALSTAKKDDPEKACDPTRGFSLLMLSVATSIDALAVGLSLSLLGAPIWTPALVIGVVCAAVTACGMYIGRKAASMSRLGHRAGLIGGLVLIGIGLRILWEHGVFS